MRLVFSLTFAALLFAKSAAAEAPSPPPRLVVLIVIDQFRHDYLHRFADLFIDGGFRRLTDGGAWMTDATYSHLHASTTPGHSVITSGTYGYRSGLIANSWYDRNLGHRRLSLVDPQSHVFGKKPEPGGRTSTREIQGSTLADEWRMSTNYRGKVFSVSMKNYSAMVCAGKLGVPYWFEPSLGRFTSGDFYLDALPAWVNAFNDRRLPASYFGRSWTRLLPEEAYAERAARDDRKNEQDYRGNGIVFPHIVTGGLKGPGPSFYAAFRRTPWASEVELAFARRLIVEEQLGRDDVPDLLVISLSANDYIGHDFGPFSQEVLDMTVRTDRQLADFFKFLDRQVDPARTLLVLTSDHGAAPLPEQSAAHGVPAGRVGPAPLTARVEAVLDAKYGPEDWVLHLYETGLYLNYAAIERRHLSHAEVEQTSAEALTADPSIAAAFTRTQITHARLPDTRLGKAVLHSFYPDKSGDVIPVAAPFYLILDDYSVKPYGTSHGQPNEYDVHVPLLFYGPWIKPGKYRLPVDMADVTPTICEIAGITMPSGRDGRILGEILY